MLDREPEAKTAAPGPKASARALERVFPRGDAVRWIVSGGSVGAVLLVWEWYGRAQETSLFFVPFTGVLAALWQLAQTSEFWAAFQQTIIPFVWGWVLSLVVGVVVGLLIGAYPTIEALTKPT